jgi:hypothetical protein
MEPHPTRLWAPRAGTQRAFGGSFTITQDLLREVKLDGSELRIITLGDSSIFGHGIEDAWTLHGQLKKALAMQSTSVEVLCGAIPGYSTEQSLRLLDEWGWDQNPDLLVIGNLWSDSARSPVSDREWYALYEAPLSRMDRALLSVSQLWTLFRSQLSQETETPVELIFERDPNGNRRVALADYAANLDQLLQEAAERGVGAVLLSPCHEKMLMSPQYQEAILTNGYFGAMNAVAAHRGVPVIQACDAIRSAGIVSRGDAFVLMNSDQPELGNDPLHPSGISNQAYSIQIARVLQEQSWPTNPLLPRTDVDKFSQPLPPGPDNL